MKASLYLDIGTTARKFVFCGHGSGLSTTVLEITKEEYVIKEGVFQRKIIDRQPMSSLTLVEIVPHSPTISNRKNGKDLWSIRLTGKNVPEGLLLEEGSNVLQIKLVAQRLFRITGLRTKLPTGWILEKLNQPHGFKKQNSCEQRTIVIPKKQQVSKIVSFSYLMLLAFFIGLAIYAYGLETRSYILVSFFLLIAGWVCTHGVFPQIKREGITINDKTIRSQFFSSRFLSAHTKMKIDHFGKISISEEKGTKNGYCLSLESDFTSSRIARGQTMTNLLWLLSYLEDNIKISCYEADKSNETEK